MSDLEQSIIADIPRLNADSQAFIRYILDRVIGIGLKTYGPWSAATDTRNMEREVADELADAVVYTGMRAVMRALKVQPPKAEPILGPAGGEAGDLSGRLDVRSTDHYCHYCLHPYVDGVCAGCGGGLP